MYDHILVYACPGCLHITKSISTHKVTWEVRLVIADDQIIFFQRFLYVCIGKHTQFITPEVTQPTDMCGNVANSKQLTIPYLWP